MLISEFFNGSKTAQIKKYPAGYSVTMFEDERLVNAVHGIGSQNKAEELAEDYVGSDSGEPVFLNE